MAMFNTKDILETINMISEENLDIRTVTMGISLLDCSSDDPKVFCDRIYDKITSRAENLVKTAGGNIVGKMTVLAEGEAADRDDIIYLEKLPLFDKDGKALD
jgi:hypothetical protein